MTRKKGTLVYVDRFLYTYMFIVIDSSHNHVTYASYEKLGVFIETCKVTEWNNFFHKNACNCVIVESS